jgi:hypothetical protein
MNAKLKEIKKFSRQINKLDQHFTFIKAIKKLLKIYHQARTVDETIAYTQLFIALWIIIENVISDLYADLLGPKKMRQKAWKQYGQKGSGGLLDLSDEQIESLSGHNIQQIKHDIRAFKSFHQWKLRNPQNISVLKKAKEINLFKKKFSTFAQLNRVRNGIHDDFTQIKAQNIQKEILLSKLVVIFTALCRFATHHNYIPSSKSVNFGIINPQN